MKEIITDIALIYFAVISLVTCIVTIVDKVRARRSKWRVPEATLITLAVFGGSVAEFLTMLVIRHKTRHMKFMLGLPLIFTAQAILVLFVLTKVF